MSHFSAPDGSSQPINNLTIQHLGTLPAFSLGILDTRTDSAWEQAAVVFINGIRQGRLIGNYHHPGLFWFSQVGHPQDIMLAGWHKRSGPDGGQPWHASRGRRQGEWAEWDDSGGDQDFNDLRVRIVKFPGVGLRTSFTGLTTVAFAEFSSWDAAVFLTSLANVKALARQMSDGEQKTAIAEYTQEVFSKVVGNYCGNTTEPDLWSAPLSQVVALTAELNFIANTFPEGNLRAELLDLIGQVLQRVNTSAEDAY